MKREPRLESALEKHFRNEVRKLGGHAFKWVPLIAGTPDRLVFLPGGYILPVELKREGEKPSAVQRVWHARLSAVGTHVYVLAGRAEVDNWIQAVAAPLAAHGVR